MCAYFFDFFLPFCLGCVLGEAALSAGGCAAAGAGAAAAGAGVGAGAGAAAAEAGAGVGTGARAVVTSSVPKKRSPNAPTPGTTN
jgi:hypothetical protein